MVTSREMYREMDSRMQLRLINCDTLDYYYIEISIVNTRQSAINQCGGPLIAHTKYIFLLIGIFMNL